jgi:hydroxymethylpyrimidine pyrophosphatase-like HAD family hydrolase
MEEVIYIDVDDTLIRSVGSKRVPMPRVVEAVRSLHARGAQIFLWSTGGAAYAQQAAIELGISSCVVAYLPKPHVYIDDQPVQDWRGCRHLLPANASDA